MNSDYERRIQNLEYRIAADERRLAKLAEQAGQALVNATQGRSNSNNGTATSAWFWTTSSISIASMTGTTVSTAVLTYGSGTARHCVKSGATSIPDTSAGVTDITVYNGLNGTPIPSGQFVKADLNDDGVWVIDIAWC